MMIFPYYDFCGFNPMIQKPPTIYTILNSIVNGNKKIEEYTKNKNLAKEGRTVIFDFDYTLSDNVSREKFETMILNHFLQRRIGFETVTAFKIQLDVKLNEIMPLYNKMFDSLENWNIFNDGEVTTTTSTDNRNSQNINDTTNNLNNTSTTTASDTSDRRHSVLPQNRLEDLRNGSYVTDYNYDTNNSTANDTSVSNGTSHATNNSTDNTVFNETITRTPSDKIAIYKEMQENIKSIYTMIFKDLECLFYQLI